MNVLLIASESAEPAEGIAAFGVNWQSLLIQAITFLLVVIILKKFVVGKIYQIIDARQAEIEAGLAKSAAAKKALEKAQDDVDIILAEARDQAQLIVSSAKNEAVTIVKSAESSASARAEAIVTEAQNAVQTDIVKAREELKKEAAKLIAEVSASVIGKKLTSESDAALITKEIKAQRNG